jgi:protein ImuA
MQARPNTAPLYSSTVPPLPTAPTAVKLQEVLHRRDTWRGRYSAVQPAETPRLDTGYRLLNRALRGQGWPTQGCIEVLSDGSGLGAMGLFLPAMTQLCAKQRWQVFINAPCMPYAPVLRARRINPQQVLMVRPQQREDLLWSMEQSLRSQTSSAVFAWLGNENYRYAELRKLQLAAAESDCLAVLFRPLQASTSHSPAALRLQVNGWRSVHILKQRGGLQGIDVDLPVDDDIPHEPQLWELPAYPADSLQQQPAAC